MNRRTWMAPGNSKIFDSFLGDNSKINLRTIGVLEYINENKNEHGYVEKKKFEEEIKVFLERKYSLPKNKSIESHFFRASLFYGFLYVNKKNQLSLTIEGSEFLKEYQEGNFQKAKKYFINQLDNVSYPNLGAKATEGLYLYPFRILFKLLLDNEKLSAEFIKTRLVNIKDYTDLKKYLVTKDLSGISRLSKLSERENKFYTWVLNSLKNTGILNEENNFYSISEDVLNQVKLLFENIDYKNMFFNNIPKDYLNMVVARKRLKRDPTLIFKAKKRDQHVCIRNKKHETFLVKNIQYTEGHHLIPLYYQKNFDFGLDDIENIVSVCPNCHREIHFSDDKKDILDSLYKERKSFFTKNKLNKNVLYKVYNI